MHIETVDAAPLTFTFSHTNTRHSTDSYSDNDDFTNSDYYEESINSHPSYPPPLHNDNELQNRSYIPQEDLQFYLDRLKDRTALTIPPVARYGLLPLEAMKIPHYDEQQLKFNPSNAQQHVLRAEAMRGSKYLLSFVTNKLHFKPSRQRTNHLHHSARLDPTQSFSSLDTRPSSSTISNPTASRHSSSDKPSSRPHALLPSSSASATAATVASVSTTTTTSTPNKNVFSRLRKKVSLIVNQSTTVQPPSPVMSDHEGDDRLSSEHKNSSINSHNAAANLKHPAVPPMPFLASTRSITGSSSQFNGSLSPSSTFSSTHSAGSLSLPLINAEKHSSRSNRGPVTSSPSAVPSGGDLNTSSSSTRVARSISGAAKKKKGGSSAGSSIISKKKKKDKDLPAVRRIKRSHHYLTNVGTLKIWGSPSKRRFDIIIDPQFPFSFIDMDAIMRETAKDRGSLEILATSFQVLATPVYSPESRHNRVVIDIELMPISEAKRHQGMFLRQRKNVIDEPVATGDDLIPDFSRIDFNSDVVYGRASVPTSGGSGENSPTDSDSASVPFASDEEISLKWFLASHDIINLMNIQPYNCILGRDWLTHLHSVCNPPEPEPVV